jgi:hypothetical protein
MIICLRQNDDRLRRMMICLRQNEGEFPQAEIFNQIKDNSSVKF